MSRVQNRVERKANFDVLTPETDSEGSILGGYIIVYPAQYFQACSAEYIRTFSQYIQPFTQYIQISSEYIWRFTEYILRFSEYIQKISQYIQAEFIQQ